MITQVLFGAVTAAAVPVLRNEALRLTNVAARGDEALLERIGIRLAPFCPVDARQTNEEPPTLEAIHSDLRSRGMIGRSPFAAVLAAPVADAAWRDVSDALGGWLVVAVLERPLGARLESLVATACDAVRLLKSKDIALLGAFDLSKALTLEDAHGMLRTAQDKAEHLGAGSHALLGRLRPIRALLDAAVRDRAPIERQVERRGIGAVPRGRAPMGLDLLLDTGDVRAFPDDPPPDPLDTPAATTAADAPMPVAHAVRRVRSYDDRARDRLRTRAIAVASATRDLELPASADLLTAHEARVLIAAAREAPSDAALTALVLSLIYGRSIERLRDALEADPVQILPAQASPPREAWGEGKGGVQTLEISVELPAFSVELPQDVGRTLTSDGRERLHLAVPPPWRPDVMLGLDLRQCDLALKAMRGLVSRPYSRNRIAGWLGAWLRNRGADPAAIGAITGQDPGGRAQMHYTRLVTAELSTLWEVALTNGLGLKPSPRPRSSAEIGARVRVPEHALARAFDALGKEVDGDRQAFRVGRGWGRGILPLADLAASHQRFALYTLELLGMATGHRPVDAPFERLGDIDLETGLAGLSDKAVAGGRSERIVALPPSAVTQLAHWISHLRALHEALAWRVEAEVADRIAASLQQGSGSAPLFFFLTPEGGIVEPRRSAILERRRTVLPVQANLARHMLRSHLVSAGVAPDAVDASLGHARLGEEPWGPVSTLSVGDLRAVAEAAEGLLQTLSLHPRPGPLAAPSVTASVSPHGTSA